MPIKFRFINILLILTLFSCQGEVEDDSFEKDPSESLTTNSKDTIRLALDWSPNVLHAGIFYADYEGMLEENNIHLEWFTTEVDNYKKKPILRLLDGEVDLAVGPSEHLFFYGDTTSQNFAVGVATILQKDQSAFVVKSSSGITSPADLDGKKYIGYKTPLEKEILTNMIKNDGGEGAFSSITPPRLSVWNAFLNDEGHAAWIFSHWEGAEAANKGINLNCFFPNEYGVPYGYSSVIMANKKRTDSQNEKIERFLKALAIAHKKLLKLETDEVVEFLASYTSHKNFKDKDMVKKAWENIRDAFLDDSENWGRMSDEVWKNYYKWIGEHDIPGFSEETEDVDIYYEALLK